MAAGSSLLCAGFLQLLRAGATLCCRARASHCGGFFYCGVWALGTRAQQLWLAGSRAQAQQLWCTGLVALRHVGSSRARDRTHVPCIGSRILNHCATREVLFFIFIFGGTRAACTFFVPPPGIEPGPQAMKAWSPNCWTAREFPSQYFIITLNGV